MNNYHGFVLPGKHSYRPIGWHRFTADKEEFVRLMRLLERFCGVRILTYCVMSNHFHLQIEIPPRPAEGLPDEELCKRIEGLKGKREAEEFRSLLEQRRAKGDEEGAAALKERHLYRMWDLGEFMKALKQRFSRWFNQRHDRRGTLWEERWSCPGR